MKKKYWSSEPIDYMRIDLKGVIHIGSHIAQEYDDYLERGIKNMVFIEPLKENYEKMLSVRNFPSDGSVKTFNLAIGNIRGEVEMNVETANQGMSSSILEPGTHLDTYPKITFDKKEMVKIDKLDNLGLDMSLYNVLNIDVQGYELEVLKGAEKTLESIDVIFTEINTGEVYKGCAKLGDLDGFLNSRAFDRVYTHEYKNINYGDAIYVKRIGLPVETHWNVLEYAIRNTTKPIFEIGAGDCSTRPIHEIAIQPILTIESNQEWMDKYKDLESDTHKFALYDEDMWSLEIDELAEANPDLGVVFVDEMTWEMRMCSVREFRHNADYVVIHDADRAKSELDIDFGRYFKYWSEYKSLRGYSMPSTVLASNRIDVSNVEINGMIKI